MDYAYHLNARALAGKIINREQEREEMDRRAAKVRPRTGAMRKRAKHWELMESFRSPAGLPSWCFDFIGIHEYSWERAYTLSSPLILVCPQTGKRPNWEQERFKTKWEAQKRAREIAREHGDILGIYIVDCTDTGE